MDITIVWDTTDEKQPPEKKTGKKAGLAELREKLMFLVVGGYHPKYPMKVESHREQTDSIIKHVEDMIAEIRYTAWNDGYNQCSFDILEANKSKP